MTYLASWITFRNLDSPSSRTISAVQDSSRVVQGWEDQSIVEDCIENLVLQLEPADLVLQRSERKRLLLSHPRAAAYLIHRRKVYVVFNSVLLILPMMVYDCLAVGGIKVLRPCLRVTSHASSQYTQTSTAALK
jgi:hypothetical protein